MHRPVLLEPRAKVPALRHLWRPVYRPSGALKAFGKVVGFSLRLPSWAGAPLFYLALIIFEVTPLGSLARLDLMAEQLGYRAIDRTR